MNLHPCLGPPSEKAIIIKFAGGKTSGNVSFKLMKTLLTVGERAFVRPKRQEVSPAILINTRKKMLQVFFRHISQLELESAVSGCLTDNIMELKKLAVRYQHLESYDDWKMGGDDRKRINTILESMEGIDSIYQKCRRER